MRFHDTGNTFVVDDITLRAERMRDTAITLSWECILDRLNKFKRLLVVPYFWL